MAQGLQRRLEEVLALEPVLLVVVVLGQGKALMGKKKKALALGNWKLMEFVLDFQEAKETRNVLDFREAVAYFEPSVPKC